jgi:hypothetical protein
MSVKRGIYRIAQLIKWVGRIIGGLFVASSAYSMMFSKPYETHSDAYGMLLMAGIVLAITEGVAWILEGFGSD